MKIFNRLPEFQSPGGAARILAIMLLVGLVSTAGAQQPPPETIDPEASCVTAECHGAIQQPEFLHGPVNLGQCAPCHVPIDNQHKFQPREGSIVDMCYVCHEQETKQDVVHSPFEADCTLCHDPHGGSNRLMVLGGLGAEGCQRCHSDVTEGLPRLHGPVALGECLVCHTAHQADHEGLLLDARPALCQSCHVDVSSTLEGAVSVHEPVPEKCAGCHEPHGGEHEYFLTAERTELCRSCHGEFLTQVEQYKYQHEPLTEGQGCIGCHEPHASTQEQLLASNNMELCLSCHNERIQYPRGTLNNIRKEVSEAKFLHGPLREQNCIACHEAHGSDFHYILEMAFPEDFYASFEPEKYDLCFDCHDKQIVLEEESTFTAFRNGETNLHYTHVNREKGRSCRACHHEHASSQPNHIRSEVPFGNWMMKVEYTKTDEGGYCTTGCHLPYKYDRENPVDNEAEVAMQ